MAPGGKCRDPRSTATSYRRCSLLHVNPNPTQGIRLQFWQIEPHLQRIIRWRRTRHVAPLPTTSLSNSPHTGLPPKPKPQPNTHIIHLNIFLLIELRKDASNGSEDIRANRARGPSTVARVGLSETTVGFETLRGDVWGAAVVAVPDYGRIVGFGGEGCNACTFGVRDGLGAALAQVEDLLRGFVREKYVLV
jgi:hypothetical protein